MNSVPPSNAAAIDPAMEYESTSCVPIRMHPDSGGPLTRSASTADRTPLLLL